MNLELVRMRSDLVLKKFSSGLTEVEIDELKTIQDELDKEEDNEFINRLEDIVDRQEQLDKDIQIALEYFRDEQ